MENYIIIAVVGIIIISIVIYLVKEKKKGSRCVGCPYGGKCSNCCSEKNTNTAKDL